MPARGVLALLLLGLTACSCNEPRGKPPAPQPSTHGRASTGARDQVLLADAGSARVVVVVPSRLSTPAPSAAPSTAPPADVPTAQPKTKRRSGKSPRPTRPRKPTPAERSLALENERLRAAVQDLSKYLSQMAGKEVPVVIAGSAPAGATPILIGELGAERFGSVGIHAPGKQGFRFVVNRSAIALYGESDVATSYAIYELLDRLGCRWFMPGDLGEVIPPAGRVALLATDEALAPSTAYRDLWYADADYKRRNRLGGVRLAAGHMLEKWISAAQRDEHPDWRAVIRGKSDSQRLRWSKPEVADAIASSIDAQLQRRPSDSVSISPLDGSNFDESVDTASDAGDWDPSMGQVSLTDRLLVLANRVAQQLAPKYPELRLGLLAYTSYTRPPVREKVHPSIVPVIAPITYCRPHPWSDDACPGAKEARQIVEGWAARSERLAYRGYAYNLAEPAAPNPMLRKWSWELPFLFAHKVQFFQPETIPNFETSLPALWLGVRLSWNPRRAPSEVINELFERFYGHAAAATRSYVDLMDRAWTETPEYAGAGLGYARRFPPELMRQARAALDAAKAACRTDVERQRVELLDLSLQQLELYMKVELDFRSGHLGELEQGLQTWLARASELGDRFSASSAFGKTAWARDGVYAAYVQRFLHPIYSEADRIAREQTLVTPHPICTARYQALPELRLPTNAPPLGQDRDPSYDFCLGTWSSLGRYDYFGSMLYRFELQLPATPAGKAAYLWFSKVDGIAQVWVNGRQVRARGADSNGPLTAEAHLKPLTFDITSAIEREANNEVAIVVQRNRLAELGAGGLLGPVYVYADR
jgi:hypothetical protein